MDLELAIALLTIFAVYGVNWYIGHRPINLIQIGHLIRTNKKSRKIAAK